MWFDIDIFGSRKKRLRELDAAILLADRLLNSLNASLAGSTEPVSTSGANAFMAAVQIRSLVELAGDDLGNALRREGSPFKAAFDIGPKWTDTKGLAEAVNALMDLLEGKRNILAQPRELPDPQAIAGAVPVNAGAGPGASPPGPIRPDDAVALWGVTEKLYVSWPVRALVLLVALAIAIALGGSFVIGGQTWNLRKTLDDAQEKAQAEIKTITETTQSRVSKESESLIARLRERGTDINTQMQRAEKEVSNLNASSESLKKDIVERLQTDLKGRESGLREEILGPLTKIRDEDIKSLTTALNGVRKTLGDVDKGTQEEDRKLALLGPKLGRLQSYADQSDKIVTALTAVAANQHATTEARTRAETDANAAILQKKVAESAAADAIERRNQVISVVKGVTDETQKHNRTLAVVDQQLKDFDAKLKQFDEKLNADIAALEARLKPIRDRIGNLENPPKTPASTPPPTVNPRRFADLNLDERKQIQRRLVEEGTEVGKIDGKFGPKSIVAVQNYQKKIGAEVTGQLTPDQVGSLLKPKS